MISNTVIKSTTKKLLEEAFYKYFIKAKKETKHIILDRLFPSQRRTSSTMSGLQTSLGSFWEVLAKDLAVQNSFEVLENSSMLRPESEPAALSSLIATVKTTRQNTGGDLTHFRNELNRLYSAAYTGTDNFIPMQKGKGSDVILKKNNSIYIFDTKTVQVNANNGNTFNETVMLWVAYYKYKYRIDANNIDARIVFPYNSSNENNDSAWWTEYGQRISPLTPNEIYVGNDFWSFLTDNSGALQSIIAGIEEVANDSDFIALYGEVFNCNNMEELREFSIVIKVKQAEKIRNITLISTENITRRHVLEWTHTNCAFKSRIGKLLDDGIFVCPRCGTEL